MRHFTRPLSLDNGDSDPPWLQAHHRAVVPKVGSLPAFTIQQPIAPTFASFKSSVGSEKCLKHSYSPSPSSGSTGSEKRLKQQIITLGYNIPFDALDAHRLLKK
ncbi:hypothetical protein Tco_0012671 [Tanacetum coccineum]